VDAFGHDDETFVTLLNGYWFLGILLSHKPFLLDRCQVSYFLMGVPCWLPVDSFEVINSSLQARKQMCSSLSLVHELLQRFDLAFWFFWDGDQRPHSLSDDKANMGCTTSTCKRAEQAFPLYNLGDQVSHWNFQPPHIFHILYRLRPPPPLGWYLGGRRRIGSSPPLAKVALSA
jgi:hypothetical protein